MIGRRKLLSLLPAALALPTVGRADDSWSYCGYGEVHAYWFGFPSGQAVGAIQITPYEICFRQIRGERTYIDPAWADFTVVRFDRWLTVVLNFGDRIVDFLCLPGSKTEKDTLARHPDYLAGRTFVSSALEGDDLIIFAELR